MCVWPQDSSLYVHDVGMHLMIGAKRRCVYCFDSSTAMLLACDHGMLTCCASPAPQRGIPSGLALHEAPPQVDQEAPVQQPHLGHASDQQHT
jgi:hypothetical protein